MSIRKRENTIAAVLLTGGGTAMVTLGVAMEGARILLLPGAFAFVLGCLLISRLEGAFEVDLKGGTFKGDLGKLTSEATAQGLTQEQTAMAAAYFTEALFGKKMNDLNPNVSETLMAALKGVNYYIVPREMFVSRAAKLSVQRALSENTEE